MLQYNMNLSCHSSGNVQLMVQNYSKYLANENLVRHLWPEILVKGPLHLQLFDKKKYKGEF